ncbi:hypothetical protein EDD29_0340 [Actinocorallia herbida]|uniref:Secreted protein n=1 Tax=Actinocorallia herbida TaxID=58109 RepID=A0A3N1CNT2_9ACTN|nr:hypothetical protein [Actinocorallia herbida]ROO82855.1 hypothetical protein EDD29_0340 [Actinocorallia herbida]
MKLRKPALLAATAALAITPALTAVTPVHAAPQVPVVAVAAAPDVNAIIAEVLAVFPAEISAIAQQILAGDYTRLLELVQLVFALPQDQLTAIFGQLTEIATRVINEILAGGTPTTEPTATATPEATEPAAADPAPADAAPAARAAGPTAQDKKVAWTLDALVQDAKGKQTPSKLANILITLSIAGR